ncbi:MAG: VCBS repeat-containing protein, partial [Bacteroidota bacterium]
KIFTPSMLERATILEMNAPLTSLIENKGNGQFELHPLPTAAQLAPVYGMQCTDVDNDGWLDLLMVGNDYGMELIMGRCDAFNGLVLRGTGPLQFEPMSLEASGFVVPFDGKSLVQFTSKDQLQLLAGQNKAALKHFSKALPNAVVRFAPMDAYAMVTDAAGKSYKVEAYYGNGFLSQSERSFVLPKGHQLVSVHTLSGNERPLN